MNKIVGIIIVLGLFLMIDLPVVLYFNKSMYQNQFTRINKTDPKSGMWVWLAGFFTYVLLAAGIYFYIVHPELEGSNSSYFNILIKSIGLGLVIYGVYNGTNMATINEWGVKEFFVDIIWGSILSGIIGCLSVYLIKMIK
jgi:uncharacterized membrane protein